MIEDYIVSFTEGRIRLRHPALKDQALGEEICNFLKDMNGILSIEHKCITGSLLIHYDHESITQEEIQALLEQGQGWLEAQSPATTTACTSAIAYKPSSWAPTQLTAAQKRKLINRTMLSTFLVTLVSGGMGNKKAHYMAGGAFAALTLAHIWRMRKVI